MADKDTQTPVENERAAQRNGDADALRAMALVAFRPDLPLKAKIEQVLAIGCTELGAELGILARIDGDLFRIEHAASTGDGAPIDFTYDLRNTLCQETLKNPGTLAIEHAGNSEYATHPAYQTFHTQTYIGAVVWTNGRKYGTLSFTSSIPRKAPFTTAEKEYVRLMALWAGSELERHSHIRDLENRVEERTRELRATAEREQLLRDIGQVIRASHDPGEIEYQASRLLGAALHADRCFFTHFNLDRDYMRFGKDWYRPDLQSIAGDYKPSAFGVDIAPMFQGGGNVVIQDVTVEGWPETTVQAVTAIQLRSFIDVPLFRDDRLEAVLCVAMETPRSWTDEEVSLVEAVAAQTRTSIEAAGVLQRERRIATTLQDALLPRLPLYLPGMQLDYAYRAALDESNVGGDFYAAYAIDEQRYVLVIGDVSGKGLAAASQVAALQNILRYAVYAARTLGEAITQMNEVVIEHNLLAGFATLFVAIYDARTRTLTYCSCGHEPALVFAGNAVEMLKTTGPPLGAMGGVQYKELRVQLAVGDTLALYTDGLSEAGPDRRTLLGIEGLTEIIRRRIGDGQVTKVASDVVADAVRFANGRLGDDICVIVAGVVDETRGVPEVVLPSQIGPASATIPLSERLRETPVEEQFRLLVDNVAEYAIFLLDVTGHIVTWNKGAERLKGYSASEVVGKHFSIFYTPEDIERGHPLEELAIVAAEGRYEEEGWRVRKDGSRFWANVVITALRDRNGQLCGFGKVTRDFTERRRAEEQLRQSEERFRLLVQGVRDYAIFMLDPSGVIVSWNIGAERINGYSADEIIGQHFSKFYTPVDIERNHPAHELEIAAAEGRYEEEGWRVRKDGSRFWANVLITALKDEAGNLYGFAKLTRDFTDRKTAEETHLQAMRDEISRSFLRDILYSVTEGRLRFCEDDHQLPPHKPCNVSDIPLNRDSLASFRSHITDTAESIGLNEYRTADIVTAASEAAMNAVVHATNATYSICVEGSTIQIWVVDHGSGIELTKLHRATLERGYTTENSLGHGFWLMLHTCDRLWLWSTSAGTTIVLEQDVAVPEPEWLSRPKEVADYLRGASSPR
jgi:PAS domain S-box-containing protein